MLCERVRFTDPPALRQSSTPGISAISSAVCGEGLSQPLGVEMVGVELSQ
jgi:hypothetical protein